MTTRPELEYAASVLGRKFVQWASLGCSTLFARALGLSAEVEVGLSAEVGFDNVLNRVLVIEAQGEVIAKVQYVIPRPYADFWDCVVVLVALAHPSPPAELEACSSLVLARGAVRIVWRKEASS